MMAKSKKLKSVGILTFTYGDNYGQRLQNLAMQDFLKEYFSEVYTIRQVEKKSPMLIHLKHVTKLLLQNQYFVLRMRRNHFEKFNDLYIRFYSNTIDAKNAMQFPKDNFDFFVCGSDQIWSPYSSDVNSTFFLTFVDKNKRIALAPSLASEDIPEVKLAEFKEYFKGFNYISTREYAGSNLVQELTGNKVETLIDPTLLFDAKYWSKYEMIPKKMCRKKYAVCYFLGGSNEISEIYEICNRDSLEVIDILNDKKYLSLGPSEFIYLIHNAQKVFTDSYHGTIFSIIFHKPFILFERKGTNINMNSRFETLFSKLGISIKHSQGMLDEGKVDYTEIEKNISKERGVFQSYLEKCLNFSNLEN